MPRRIASKTFRLQYLVSLEFGVPPQEDLQARDLEDPDATVSDATVYAHLEAVAQHLGARTGAFVVALARQHRITSVGLPGFAMRTAPSLRQGLTSLLRYQHLTNTLARFDLLEHDAVVVWSEERFGSPRPGHLLATEVALLSAVHIARGLVGEALVPSRAEIRRAAVPKAYIDFLGCPVGASAPRGTLTFPRTWLERAIPSADEDMSTFFHAELERRRQTTEARAQVVADLRGYLGPHLMRGAPSLGAAGAALGVSARTLQRRLQEEGTTFAEVVDGVRRDLAAAYLQNAEYTAAEVAFMLGYAEASSFHRAFRRWTGTTPEAFRSGGDRSAGGPAG